MPSAFASAELAISEKALCESVAITGAVKVVIRLCNHAPRSTLLARLPLLACTWNGHTQPGGDKYALRDAYEVHNCVMDIAVPQHRCRAVNAIACRVLRMAAITILFQAALRQNSRCNA
jgi:hypothetical protein